MQRLNRDATHAFYETREHAVIRKTDIRHEGYSLLESTGIPTLYERFDRFIGSRTRHANSSLVRHLQIFEKKSSSSIQIDRDVLQNFLVYRFERHMPTLRQPLYVRTENHIPVFRIELLVSEELGKRIERTVRI